MSHLSQLSSVFFKIISHLQYVWQWTTCTAGIWNTSQQERHSWTTPSKRDRKPACTIAGPSLEVNVINNTSASFSAVQPVNSVSLSY